MDYHVQITFVWDCVYVCPWLHMFFLCKSFSIIYSAYLIALYNMYTFSLYVHPSMQLCFYLYLSINLLPYFLIYFITSTRYMCVSLPHCHHLWPSIKPLSTLIPASLLLCPCCLVHNTTFFLIVTDVWPSCPHPPACHSGVVVCCDVFYGEEWCVWSGVYLFILFTVSL